MVGEWRQDGKNNECMKERFGTGVTKKSRWELWLNVWSMIHIDPMNISLNHIIVWAFMNYDYESAL